MMQNIPLELSGFPWISGAPTAAAAHSTLIVTPQFCDSPWIPENLHAKATPHALLMSSLNLQYSM
jgi:hypothetical protein